MCAYLFFSINTSNSRFESHATFQAATLKIEFGSVETALSGVVACIAMQYIALHYIYSHTVFQIDKIGSWACRCNLRVRDAKVMYETIPMQALVIHYSPFTFRKSLTQNLLAFQSSQRPIIYIHNIASLWVFERAREQANDCTQILFDSFFCHSFSFVFFNRVWFHSLWLAEVTIVYFLCQNSHVSAFKWCHPMNLPYNLNVLDCLTFDN